MLLSADLYSVFVPHANKQMLDPDDIIHGRRQLLNHRDLKNKNK